MTLYGPLTAQDYLKLLRSLTEEEPTKEFFDAALSAIVETAQAERGFLLTLSADGAFRVVTARTHEGTPVRRPRACISQFALQRAAASEDGAHLTNSAQVDRRYRTEGVYEGRRQPCAILALASRGDRDRRSVVYLDHRFQPLAHDDHLRTSLEHWLVLIELALRLRAEAPAPAPAIPRPHAPPDPPQPEAPAEPVAPVEFHGLWSCSPKLVEIFRSIERLGKSEIPVVVQGETGTGKTLMAAAVHASSRRADRPFLSVNCGAIPDALLESELFGHVKGAFTGAETDRIGLLEQADGGTLFLDEISDMSGGMQKKLLRFLENGRFRALGAKQESRADVRLISATRLDLQEEAAQGGFRADLYYRLCGVVLQAPPLREHREDICPLAERFLARHHEALESEGEAPILGDSARDWLLRHTWPGNIRELENLMRQMVALGVRRITSASLERAAGAGDIRLHGARRLETLDEVIAAAEREAISRALEHTGGNKSQAARQLGITRKALYRRLEKYGLAGDEGGGESRGAPTASPPGAVASSGRREEEATR